MFIFCIFNKVVSCFNVVSQANCVQNSIFCSNVFFLVTKESDSFSMSYWKWIVWYSKREKFTSAVRYFFVVTRESNLFLYTYIKWWPVYSPPENSPRKVPLRFFPPGTFPPNETRLCEICRWREPVPTRALNPNASEASYKPKQRS